MIFSTILKNLYLVDNYNYNNILDEMGYLRVHSIKFPCVDLS